MTDTPNKPEDDEIDLLDLLLTIAENIKLLVIGPLLAGMLALVGVWFWPATYESSFTLNAQKTLATDGVNITPQQISAIALTKPTLDAAAQALTTAKQPDLAQRILAGAATSSVPRNTPHALVTLQAPTAQAAHDMAQALLSATLQASRPQGEELARVMQDLQKSQAALDNARTLETRLNHSIKQGKGSDEELVKNYAALLPVISDQAKVVDQQRARLAGLGENDIVAMPTVPTAPSKPRKNLVVVMAVLASGFVLLLFVFIRKAMRNGLTNPETARKLALIRKALGKAQ
jgi:capsular polysaccharide biosynthesis protein